MSRLSARLRKLEEEVDSLRCDNCRKLEEWVVRYDGSGEPYPAECPRCGFQQGVILVCFTEEAARL